MKTKKPKNNCKFATQTGDSFGKYISTYCHKKNIHIHGFSNCDSSVCENCADYKKK